MTTTTTTPSQSPPSPSSSPSSALPSKQKKKPPSWKRPTQQSFHAHFDCFSGAAGDMLLASCLDAAAAAGAAGHDNNGHDDDDHDDGHDGHDGHDEHEHEHDHALVRLLLEHVKECLRQGLPDIANDFDITYHRVQRGRRASIAASYIKVHSRYQHAPAPVPVPMKPQDGTSTGTSSHDHAGQQHPAHDHNHKHKHNHGHSHDAHSHNHGHNQEHEDESSHTTSMPTVLPVLPVSTSVFDATSNTATCDDQHNNHNQNHNHSHNHGHELNEHAHGHDDHDEAETDHHHSHAHHSHSHAHHHHHDDDDNGITSSSSTSSSIGPLRNLPQIQQMLEQASPDFIPPWVRDTAIQVFTELAKAEAKTHGASSMDTVHFHEVGAIDSIVDTVGTLIALYALNVTTVSCSRLPLGHGGGGSGTCWGGMHGILPVPAPATLRLLQDMAVCSGPPGVTGELVTPTGAALLRVLVLLGSSSSRNTMTQSSSKSSSRSTRNDDDDGSNKKNDNPRRHHHHHHHDPQPPNMTIRAIGHGAGTKDFDNHPNIVRLILGERD